MTERVRRRTCPARSLQDRRINGELKPLAEEIFHTGGGVFHIDPALLDLGAPSSPLL